MNQWEPPVDNEQIAVFQAIAEAINRATNLPTSIWVLDKRRQALRIAASIGLPASYARQAFLSLDEPSVTGEAFKTGEVAMAHDILSDPRWKYKQEAQEMGWKAALCVPFKVRGAVMGVISIYTFVRREFTELERHLLSDYAAQIGLTFEAEVTRRTLLRLLEVGQQIEKAITRQPKIVLEEIVKSACELIGADCAVLYPYDYQREEFYDIESVAVYGLKYELKLSEKPRSKTGMAAYVQRVGELILSDIEREDPEMLKSPFIEREGVRAFMGVALKVGEEVLGVLYVNFREPHQFTDEEKNIIRLFAHQAAIAVHNSRLYQQATTRAEALRTLHRVSPALASLPTGPGKLPDVLLQIAQNALTVLGADLIDLYQYIQSRDDFILPPVLAGERYHPFVPKKRIFEDDVLRAVVRKRQPEYILNAQEHPDLVQPFTVDRPDIPKARFVVREEVKSTAVVPLMFGTEIVGVLFANYRSPQTFPPEQRELIELFAAQAAIAIRNARLVDQYRVLQEIGRDITSVLDKDELLQKILSRSLELLGCEIGSICLLDETTNLLEFQYAIGKERYLSVPFGKGLIGTAAKERRPIRVGDVTQDKRYIKHVEDTRSELDVPMMIGDRLIGVLNAESTRYDAFDEHSEELARILASYAAVALYNADLFDRTREQLEQRVADLQALRDVYKAVSEASLEEVLRLVVEQAVKSTGAQYGNLWLLDRKRNELEFGTEVNLLPERPRRDERIPVDPHSINGWVAITGKSYLCNDVTVDEHYQKIIESVRSELAVPLRHGKDIIGTLNVESTRAGAFTEDHRQLLEALSGPAAEAIAAAQLYHRLNTVIEMGQSLTKRSTRAREDEVLRLIYTHTSELMDTQNMYIALYDEVTDTVRFGLAYVNGRPVDVEKEEGWQPRRAGKGRTEEIIRTRQPIFHATRAESEAWYAQPEHKEYIGRPFASWLGVPMMVGDRVIGVIAVYHPELDYVYTEDDRLILQAIANQAAIALDNSRLFYNVNRRLEALVNFGQKVTSGIELSEQKILELVYEQAGNVMNTDNLYIALYDEVTDTVRFGLAYVNGQPVDVEKEEGWQPRRAGKGRTEEIIRTRQPIFHATRAESEAWYAQPERKEYTGGPIWASWLGVPMMVGDRVIGVIAVYDPERDHVYRGEDKDILQALANQAAVAIENARLFQQARQRGDALSLLYKVGRQISETLDIGQIMPLIVTGAMELTGTDSGVIHLLDGEGQSVLRSFEFPKDFQHPTPRLSQPGTMTRTIVDTRQIIAVPDVASDPRVSRIMVEKGVKSLIGVPIMRGEQVLGVLYLNSGQPHDFTEEEQSLLRSLADQAAIAIENARLYEEARSEALAAKQLATLGTAMATLQHRINNTFNIIVPNVMRLRRRVDPMDTEVTEILDIIERNARLTSEMIARIQEPLREIEPQEVDVNAVITEMTSKVAEQWEKDPARPKVMVTLDLDDSIPRIHAPIGQIAEIFRNLVDNAYRAMRESGGQLTITSRLDDSIVCIRVQDTGPGIPSQIQQRLFNRPVPSKDPQEGTGLGLWLSRLILESLGGKIGIEHTDRTGTTMQVQIPVPTTRKEVQ